MTNEQVENVMALAFELARIREEHGAQSGMYLSEVRALRAEVERLAAQSAPTEPTDYKAWGLALWAKAQAQVTDSEAASNEAFDNTFHKIAADVSRDRWNKIWHMAAKWQRYYTIRTRGAQSAPLQQAAREYPPLPEAVAWQKARIQANEICDCIVGWDYCWNVHEFNGLRIPKRALFTIEQLRAYVDADRAAEAIQRKFCAVNAGRVIPADGEVRPTQAQGQDAAPADPAHTVAALQAENERLVREVVSRNKAALEGRQATEVLSQTLDCYEALESERDALAARVAELEKDAERYRWLRDQNDWHVQPRIIANDGDVWGLTFYTPHSVTDSTDDDNLDKAIDAALAAKGQA